MDNFKLFDWLHNLLFLLFSNNGSGKAGGGAGQPLVSWSEVPGHTGLLYCMAQTSNNPIVLMVKPDVILLQEVKVQPAKAKVCLLLQIINMYFCELSYYTDNTLSIFSNYWNPK